MLGFGGRKLTAATGIQYNTLRLEWWGNAEEDVPTQEDTKEEEARFSCSYGYSWWASRSEAETAQGPPPARGIRLLPWQDAQREEAQEEFAIRYGLHPGKNLGWEPCRAESVAQ